MEVYDTDISEEEMELLIMLDKKRKRKRLLIIGAVVLVVTIFAVLTVLALTFKEPESIIDLVLQNDF